MSRTALQSHAVTATYDFTTKEGAIGVHHGYLPEMETVVALFTGIDAEVEVIQCWTGSTTIAIFTKQNGGWMNVFVSKPAAPSIRA
ncbi:hypothetical protein [Mesorhizobium sophorae]|uniref:hypothetical protein n=1 Tax=Mesorhizobium sophorae TaxID=1300294 RepID=UPI00117C604C|nr:hypothetical protein [Mesorhizobium sophorae]